MEGLPIEQIEFLKPENLPKELQAVIRYKNLATGQTLFDLGEPALAIYAVESGRIRLERYTPNGKCVPFKIVRKGECFATMALFKNVYECHSIAEVPSRVIVYPKQALLDRLPNLPNLSQELMQQLVGDIQILKIRLELREIRIARDRILHYLQSITKFSGNTVKFERPLKMVALDLGLTPEVFYRSLAQLEKKGIISRLNREVTINT